MKPEIIGPATAIRRFMERNSGKVFEPGERCFAEFITELKAMTADERWDFAREAVKELHGCVLAERRK